MAQKENPKKYRLLEDDDREILRLDHQQLLELAHAEQEDLLRMRSQTRRQTTSTKTWR